MATIKVSFTTLFPLERIVGRTAQKAVERENRKEKLTKRFPPARKLVHD